MIIKLIHTWIDSPSIKEEEAGETGEDDDEGEEARSFYSLREEGGLSTPYDRPLRLGLSCRTGEGGSADLDAVRRGLLQPPDLPLRPASYEE